MLSLEGVRVLSFTHFFQGPYCAQLLGDLGADLIKVEPPEGGYERMQSAMRAFQGGVSSFHLAVNRNQRSVSVDLKSEDGLEFVHRLLEKTHIVIQNYRPGVLEKFGLGYDDLKEKYPGLIYAELTGWGSSGPYRERPGHDVIAQGMSGLASVGGRSDQPPVVVGTSLVDAAGAMLAAYGILAAYVDFLRTGKGHKVDSCLLNAGMCLQVEPYAAYFIKGALFPKLDTGGTSRSHNMPWGSYETKDGHLIVSRIWIPVMKEIFEDERVRELQEGDQMVRRDVVDDIICKELKKKTTDEWVRILTEKKCWFSKARDYDEIVADPQVIHNGMIQEYDHPVAGRVKVLGNPVTFDGQNLPIRRYPPLLGQQTVELMKECGYSDAEIADRLERKAVVASSLPEDARGTER
jgi:crotonobetainyl-CoA:carnitine CoA-transferase CaiB-like acyl-CoA transferase